MADSVSLAAQLLGKPTAPAQEAIKAETRLTVQETLNSMDPVDREVLALKHFEQLSTAEVAEILGLSKAGAGSRYLKAIKRLREILENIPGFEALYANRGREKFSGRRARRGIRAPPRPDPDEPVVRGSACCRRIADLSDCGFRGHSV